MGKMGMVIVFGMSLASMFLGYKINQSHVSSVTNMSGYFKYTMARNIAHAAVDVALHELEMGNDSTELFTGSVMGGTYTVDVVFVRDTVDMASRGYYVDTTYSIALRLERYAKPFPEVQGAVVLPVNRVGFTMQGSTSIDGRDHDINGNLQPGAESKAGVVTLSEADSVAVAAFSNRIMGSPQVSIDTAMSDPLKFVDEYIANADYTYNAGVYGSNATWGSAESPAIVVCDAGSGTVEFTGSIEGWGILVVKGKLGLAGTFKFHGLVLVYQEGASEAELSMGVGASKIVGGILMDGAEGSKFTMKGNAQVVYSSAALDNAEHMKKLMAYRILSWYE